jgi:cell division initiation protein
MCARVGGGATAPGPLSHGRASPRAGTIGGMSVTALEIAQRQFKRAFRGLDPEDVQGFLGEVSGGFEVLAREVQDLRDQLARQGDDLEGYKARERMVHETLVMAQKACDDIRDSARREAEGMIADAELEAERIVQGAQLRFQKVVDEVHELKRQRIQLAAQLRSVLRAHERLLEALGDGDERAEPAAAKRRPEETAC